jgi:3-(3-hydroxy-phenyl)propionate hydroxylase
VVVVGAGPVGLTVANLLGVRGVPVVLIERHATTSSDAKAISLDDESLRTMQQTGLASAIGDVIVPGTGTKYFGLAGRPLFHARGPSQSPHGHPFKSSFAQPELERVLSHGLERFGHVETRFGAELAGLAVHPDGVTVTVTQAGSAAEIEASFLLGCDGGRSTVRELRQIPMAGRAFDQVWLVIDALNDAHDERYGMHYGDPERPHVIVPGRAGRCRYEFLLKPGEGQAGEPPPFELVQRLLAPYRTLGPGDVERAVAYSFYALLAQRFRDGRCFLLGDAAHMMPPFAGQGLNSGIRDAANLVWKIDFVRAGLMGEWLLDTYESERQPHARATMELSVRLGDIVMTTSQRRASLRDAVVRTVLLTSRGRSFLREMRYRPRMAVTRGLVIDLGPGPAQGLLGRALPQPQVLAGSSHQLTRLDHVLGPDFAVLGVDVGAGDWVRWNQSAGLAERTRQVDVMLDDRAAHETDGRQSIADADGALQRSFSAARGHFVLVRPDRIVAAAVTPDQLGQLWRRFGEFTSAGARPAAGPATASEVAAAPAGAPLRPAQNGSANGLSAADPHRPRRRIR